MGKREREKERYTQNGTIKYREKEMDGNNNKSPVVGFDQRKWASWRPKGCRFEIKIQPWGRMLRRDCVCYFVCVCV